MLVPTKRLWAAIALGIPVAAFGASFGVPSLAIFYNLLLAAVAFATYRLGPDPKKLRLTRRFDPVLSVRAPNVVRLTLTNEGLEPVRGRMRDEPPPDFECSQREFGIQLGAEREVDLQYVLTPRERGGDFFRGTWVRLACPLGLVEKQAKLNTEQPIRVYPNVLALREFELLRQEGRLREMGIRKTRIRGLGTEFESLREYAEGDDYRKIDWKASARRGKLTVRQFETERNQAVLLVLDVGRHMLAEVDGVRKLDRALDAVLMLVHAAVQAGDQVGLLVYGEHVRRYIPPRKGRGQLGVVIEAIHDLVAEPIESDPAAAFAYLQSRWKRRSLLAVFTDLEEPERAKALASAMGSASRRHLCLIARVADPKLKEALVQPISEAGPMFQRAAAVMLHQDRLQAGGVLSASGIHSLESDPDELASDLVSFYFSAKERALI